MTRDQETSAAWMWICLAHTARCLADRSYSFFLPLFFSSQCTSSALRPTATVTIVQNLAVALLSTTVAKLYDKSGKGGFEVFTKATLLENLAVAAGGSIIYSTFQGEKSNLDTNGGMSVCDSPLSDKAFVFYLCFSAIDAIFSSFLSLIISKEWVAAVFESGSKKGQKDSFGLSKANARLSQIDLIIATICPILISWGIEEYGYHRILFMLIIQHLVGATLIIYSAKKAVFYKPFLIQKKNETIKEKEKKNQKHNSFVNVYRTLPIQTKLVLLAYVLLYLTVLSPGGILNAWMNSLNGKFYINEKIIAYAGSSSQLCGAFSTLISPYFIKYATTLHHASRFAQWLQSICILIGVYSFYEISNKLGSSDDNTESGTSSFLLLQFLASISLSRIGLWTFDLVERQLLQETVPKSHQTVFFNGEKGITQILSLIMMGFCYIFSNPESFSILVTISVAAVTCSSILLGIAVMFT